MDWRALKEWLCVYRFLTEGGAMVLQHEKCAKKPMMPTLYSCLVYHCIITWNLCLSKCVFLFFSHHQFSFETPLYLTFYLGANPLGILLAVLRRCSLRSVYACHYENSWCYLLPAKVLDFCLISTLLLLEQQLNCLLKWPNMPFFSDVTRALCLFVSTASFTPMFHFYTQLLGVDLSQRLLSLALASYHIF